MKSRFENTKEATGESSFGFFEVVVIQIVVLTMLLAGDMTDVVSPQQGWWAIAATACSVTHAIWKGISVVNTMLPAMVVAFMLIGSPLFDMLLWSLLALYFSQVGQRSHVK